MAATGQLRDVNFGVTKYGEVLDVNSFETMADGDAAAWVVETAARLFGTAGADASRNLIAVSGPRRAALRLFAKLRAAAARFSSVDDEEGEP